MKKRFFEPDLLLLLLFVAVGADTRALGIYFIGLMAYLALQTQRARWPHTVFLGKITVLYGLAVASLFGLGVLNMTDRYDYLFRGADPVEALASKTHDGLILNEEAVRLFLEGKSPYAADFSDTGIQWIPGPIADAPNPTNTHLVYQPATFVLPAPFKGIIENTLGYFDLRPFYFGLYILGVMLLPVFGTNRTQKLGLVMALALNSSLILFTAEGRNDILGLVLLLLAWFFISVRRQVMVAAAIMGVAFATKQSVWLMAPFFAAYLLGDDWSWEHIKRTALRLWPVPVVMAAFILPFFSQAYLDDVFRYPGGSLPDSYPIHGFTLARLLAELHIIPSHLAPWPATLLQVLLGVPLMGLMLWWQRKHNTMQVAWANYAVLTMWAGFLARYFNNNLISYTVSCMIIAWWARPPNEALHRSIVHAQLDNTQAE